MANVTVKFATDDKEAQKAFDRLISDYAKLQEANRKLKEESKNASKEMSGGIGEVVGDLKGMVAGFVGVSAIVTAGVSAFEEWHAEISAMAAKAKELNKDLIAAAAASGDIKNADVLSSRLKGISGATYAQGLSAYQSISAAQPQLPFEQRVQLAENIAPLAPAGMDLGKLGALAGTLQDAAPEKTAGDIADLAAGIQSLAGERAEGIDDSFMRAVTQLKEQGIVGSMEEGIGTGLAAMEANLSPKVVEQMVAASTDTYKGKAKSAAERRFRNASTQDRFRMLMEDEEVSRAMLGDSGLKAGLLSGDRAAELGAQLGTMQETDFAKTTLTDLASTVAGGKELHANEIAESMEDGTEKLVDRETRWQEALKLIKSRAAESGNQAHIVGANLTGSKSMSWLYAGHADPGGAILENAPLVTQEDRAKFNSAFPMDGMRGGEASEIVNVLKRIERNQHGGKPAAHVEER